MTSATMPCSVIPLCSFYVAGFQYHDGARVLPWLELGERLVLRREPTNRYDHRAIALLTTGGAKLGYLPRAINTIPAEMLDRGQHIVATVRECRREGPTWEAVRVEMGIVG